MAFSRKVLILWLTRILSIPLLAEVIFVLTQDIPKVKEKEILKGKGQKLNQFINEYFEAF